MSSSNNPFIELSDHWLSITRKEHPSRGYGKWMLHTEEPHRLYQILREEMKKGALKEAYSIKTKADPPKNADAEFLIIRSRLPPEVFAKK